MLALVERLPFQAFSLVFAFYKDVDGGWWEHPRPNDKKLRRKHGVLLLRDMAECVLVSAEVLARAQPERTPG